MHVFFPYTLAYDTVSFKFDCVGIWLSMDEYIEYFFQEKCSHRSFTRILQHSKPTKARANWCWNIVYTKDNIWHLPVHMHYIFGVIIFCTCQFWSVKWTCAAMPPSQCCASPPPPPLPCLTSPSPPHEGRGCSAHWRHRLGSFLYHRCFLVQLMIHRWRNYYCLLPCQAPVGDADCTVVSLFLPRITVKTASKVFFPTLLVVE